MIPETAPSRLSSTAKRMSFQAFLAVAVAILFPFPGLGQANSSGMFPLVFADFCGGVSDHPPILSGIFAAFFVFLAFARLFVRKKDRAYPLLSLSVLSVLVALISGVAAILALALKTPHYPLAGYYGAVALLSVAIFVLDVRAKALAVGSGKSLAVISAAFVSVSVILVLLLALQPFLLLIH